MMGEGYPLELVLVNMMGEGYFLDLVLVKEEIYELVRFFLYFVLSEA